MGSRRMANTNSAAAMAVLVLLGWAPSMALCQPRVVLQHESDRQESFRHDAPLFRPLWEGRALLGVEANDSDAPVICGVDRDGSLERVDFSIAGGRYITIGGLSGAEDGSIGVIGVALNVAGQPGAFVSRVAPDRSRRVLVQVWPYVPHAVTISADGGMWTVGWVRSGEQVARYNVLERFDASGKFLTSSTIVARRNEALRQDATQASLLKSSRDRVGWLSNGNEYIEFGLDGVEIGRFQPPPGPTPAWFATTLALSYNNEVIIGTRDGDGLKVYSLERESRTWAPVGLSGAKLSTSAILGFDGDRLVVIDRRTSVGAVVSRYGVSRMK